MPIKRVQKGRLKPPVIARPERGRLPASGGKQSPAIKRGIAASPRRNVRAPRNDKVKPDTSGGYSAKNITVLEGLEAVRRRPGMYIGSTGTTGLHHLVWEVVDNSIDEAMAGHCDQIDIALLPGHLVEVRDNGRGIPVDIHPQQKVSALEVVLTKLHAGGKFGDGGYKVSGGLHGVGVSVVNALSSYVKAEVHRDGKIWLQEYKNGGQPVKKVRAIGPAKDTGTTITFLPDASVFETLDFDWKTIVDHIRQQAYLNKGVLISVSDRRQGEEKTKDGTALPYPNPSYQFYFEGGIASYVRHLNQNKELKNETIFYVDKETDGVRVETALQYTDEYTESLFAFTNNIHNPEGGTHVAGFRAALTRGLNTYARNKNILKEKDANLTGEDAREGLNCVISVKVREPQFEGQTKAKLGNTEVKTAVESVFGDAFLIYLEEHPRDAEAIVGKCILASKARNAAKIARDAILRKGALEGFTLPGKLADCSSRHAEESELFLVEGDSAGGCFFGSTKLKLADGRSLSFKELVEENKQEKKNYCYTIKEDGDIGIELIKNPRMTKTGAEVIKVILDNDEEIICTPDHKFMLRNGEYKVAQNLTPCDSLMPLYRKISEKSGRITIEGYEMTFNPKDARWIFTHLLADDYNLRNGVYPDDRGTNKHHVDFNKLNNNPDNIVRMTHEDHMAYHAMMLQFGLHRADVKEKSKKAHQSEGFKEKMSRIMSTPEMKQMLSRRAKKQWENEEYKKFMTQKFLEFYNSNEEYKKKNNDFLNKAQEEYWADKANRKKQAERVTAHFKEHPERKKWLRDFAKREWTDKNLLKWRAGKTKEQWTDEFRRKRKEAYDKVYLTSSLAFAKKLLESKEDMLKKYDTARINLPKKNTNLLSLRTLIDRFFNGQKQNFLEAVANYNHKIIRIEKVAEKMDVYDIEVPHTHNFALASGVFVHNSAKSGRDREHQAILPLRGKVLNVERARLDKIIGNNELKSLIIALGTNIGEQFDISKLRYHRIVIMTDADVDGAHIRTLLLTFFYRHFQDLITGGHIYIAQPPLYSVKYGKEMKYAFNDEEKEKILKELQGKGKTAKISSPARGEDEGGAGTEAESGEEEAQSLVVGGVKVNIQRYKGLGEMNPEQLWETTMNPENRIMKQVTAENAEAANQMFEVLMGDEVEPRKKFIQTHAKQVQNLDV
ncbi:DNA topoisomerase (ATP-hydrolyzing) subunit B [Patescibacteria group bacterium]|nr:MAG: DNA topoisomerase (ATP-hydrolyzing) subunit B [Patescibacteria group bacterium]